MSQRNIPPWRVIVVGASSLFEEGVTKLLAEEPNLQVSSITYIDDITLLQEISHAQPDMVVLNEARLLDSVRTVELLMKILEDLTNSQVIVIRPDSNTIDIYEKREITAYEGGDLLALIRNHNNAVA